MGRRKDENYTEKKHEEEYESVGRLSRMVGIGIRSGRSLLLVPDEVGPKAWRHGKTSFTQGKAYTCFQLDQRPTRAKGDTQQEMYKVHHKGP